MGPPPIPIDKLTTEGLIEALEYMRRPEALEAAKAAAADIRAVRCLPVGAPRTNPGRAGSVGVGWSCSGWQGVSSGLGHVCGVGLGVGRMVSGRKTFPCADGVLKVLYRTRACHAYRSQSC